MGGLGWREPCFTWGRRRSLGSRGQMTLAVIESPAPSPLPESSVSGHHSLGVAVWHRKGELEDVAEARPWRREECPGFPRWAQSNHRVPGRRWEEGPSQRRCDNRSRGVSNRVLSGAKDHGQPLEAPGKGKKEASPGAFGRQAALSPLGLSPRGPMPAF